MEIELDAITKEFGRERVFKNVSCLIAAGSRTAILGPNGSGKSTLLKVLAGAIVPTSGAITFRSRGKNVAEEELYRYVSIAAPYLGLYEDLSLKETLAFHARFSAFRAGLTGQEIARSAYLESAWDKPVLHFSSGMKQRLKLALAILSGTDLLLLDEPCSNLDAEAVEWYRKLLASNMEGRTLIVASNRQAVEYELCTEFIEMERWKGSKSLPSSPGPGPGSA